MTQRVLQVVDALDGGGAERHVVDLARALDARGFDVAIAASTDGPARARLEAAGVEVHVVADGLVKRRTSVRYALGLRALVARLRPNVVHAHIHASEVAAAAAVWRSDVPLVLTEHTEAPWRGRSARAALRWAARRADLVVAVSSAVARRLVTEHGVAAEKVRVLLPAVLPHVPAPVDPPLARRPLVGTVGRLVPGKGVDVLLRALAGRALAGTPAGYLVVGDGPERCALERLAADLGVRDRVAFAGWREDARDLVAALDVLAVPSREDGSPLVVLEALGAGVPVVGSRVGGIPDQVTDGREGLLVAPGDPGALGEALARVLGDAGLRSALGAAGRLRAEQFGHAEMVDTLAGHYLRLAAGARVRPAPARLRPTRPRPTLVSPVLPSSALVSPALPSPALMNPALPSPALPSPALPSPALPTASQNRWQTGGTAPPFRVPRSGGSARVCPLPPPAPLDR
jgi:glycosyltransferase involved in cell wall biosynthesis